jgi:hypothetical protein
MRDALGSLRFRKWYVPFTLGIGLPIFAIPIAGQPSFAALAALPEVRVRSYATASDAERVELDALKRQYEAVFYVLGTAKRCGLEWQKTYDDLVARLEQRHGPDMDRIAISGAMHSGAQGVEARFASGSQTCTAAADQLARFTLPDVSPSLIARTEDRERRIRPRRPAGPDADVYLAPDSRFVQTLYRQSLPSDPFKLLVVRETLKLAGDDEAAALLDRYLQRLALSALAGEPVAPPGTVEQVIGSEWGTASSLAERRKKVLESSLRPRAAQSDGKECAYSPFGRMHSECRYEGHSVWTGFSQGPYWIYLRVFFENTSNYTVAQFHAALRVDRKEGGEPFKLACFQLSGTEGGLAPGQRLEFFCREEVRRVPPDKLIEALKGVETDTSRWNLEISGINFSHPSVTVTSKEASWGVTNTSEAHEQAKAAARAAGCTARGSCAYDINYQFGHNPVWPAGTVGFGLGASVACVTWASTRRSRFNTALIVAIVAGLLGLLELLAPAFWALLAFPFIVFGLSTLAFVTVFGGYAMLGFAAGFLLTALALRITSSRKPTAP